MTQIKMPKYPIYIVSKGRWETRMTAKCLIEAGIEFRIVIEPQEHKQYSSVIDPAKILCLPFSNLGQGSIPARNWIWEHAIEQGTYRHWCLDDNIKNFQRLNHNKRSVIDPKEAFEACEEFTDRYENVALSGMQYDFFVPPKNKRPPFIANTRVYSCILIRTDLPYRWRGRYNEDTDLSLRALKDGWCTILFTTYLCKKMATMKMKGGNTDELYKDNGRLLMAQSLQQQHPDIVKVVRKYNRWQHSVDYRPFRKNRLIPKSDSAKFMNE